MLFKFLKYFFFIVVIAFYSCGTPRRIIPISKRVKEYQSNKPFVFKNTIELNGGDFSKDERNALKQKMYTLLDDSSKAVPKDFAFFIHTLRKPPAFDSGYASISSNNIKSSLIHLGYYSVKDTFETKVDTLIALEYKFPFKFQWRRQERASVKYKIETGPPTLIDTMAYRFKKPDMQQLALATKKESFLKKPNPVTKLGVLSEISRMVELYRNNGYYKITPDDVKVLGDTTIEALTNISDDPFENLQKLTEAARKRDSPTIKLAMIQNPNADSNRVKRYYIDSIIIYPDFIAQDTNAKYTDENIGGNVVKWYRYPDRIVKRYLLVNNLYFKKDSLYSLEKYNKTISSFSRLGVWQSINIEVKEKEKNDSTGKIDMILQLVPAKKFGFESNIEASYSTNSNNVSVANAGNLLGFSGNTSLQIRNTAKQGIKTTIALRAGVELNLNDAGNSNKRVNSSEIGTTVTFSFPKLIFPFRQWNRRNFLSKQSFVSINASGTNRISLFKLFSFGLSSGNEFSKKPNRSWLVKVLNVEYSNLYDRSDDFNQALADNPFLKYSYNTALVIGHAVRYSQTFFNANKSSTVTSNFETSGFLFDQFSIFEKDIKKFVKCDFEYLYTVNQQKSKQFAARFFLGYGRPIGKDTTLPFFKQYFAGGPNSMRGWPIRGLGPGSKYPTAYNSRFLSDRTGDVRLELNLEERFPIAQIIPNTLLLKGAVFMDIGNIWNSKTTVPNGGYDSSLFNIKNLYKQLGMNAGFGLRFDFNYIVLRADFGFRFKRPELAENGGWKAPSIGFNDLFKKIFAKGPNEEYRKWRYENFNFTIGLNYPF